MTDNEIKEAKSTEITILTKDGKVYKTTLGKLAKAPRGNGFITLPPLVAKYIVDHCNMNNRDMRDSAVDKYSSDMKNGQWSDDVSTIMFDIHGNVINGQHSVYSVVKSDTVQSFNLTVGHPPTDKKDIDNLAIRKAKDYLKWLGYDNPAEIESCIKGVAGLKRGFMVGQGADHLTITDIVDLAEEWCVNKKATTSTTQPCVSESVKLAKKWCKPSTTPFTLRFATALLFILSEKDRPKADLFMEILITGVIPKTCVAPSWANDVVKCHNKWVLGRNTTDKTYTKNMFICATVVNMWNKIQKGQKVTWGGCMHKITPAGGDYRYVSGKNKQAEPVRTKKGRMYIDTYEYLTEAYDRDETQAFQTIL